MRRSRLLFLTLLLSAAGACRSAPSPFAGSTIIPAYFQVGSPAPAVPQCATLSGFSVVETRQDPLVVGQRYHEERPQDRFAITATTEPARWVQSALGEAFRGATLATQVAGKGAVVAQLAAFDLQEKSAFNSVYKAKVVLDVTVTKPASNDACWTGRVEGLAENYGEAGKHENYLQTLNHAIDRAAISLLVDPAFLDAVCGSCAKPAGDPRSL